MATVRKKITTVPRSPRTSSGIRIEGTEVSQNQEYLVTGDHYPDRRQIPLVLQPYCTYTDAISGKHVDNAMPEVTDGQWYRLDSSNGSLGLCAATMLDLSATGTGVDGNPMTLFSVVSTPGAANYGRLTVRENVPAGESITYVFTGTLTTDGRQLREYFTSRCDSKTQIPDIYFDNDDSGRYNPFEDPQWFAIHPSLSAPLPVVWSWQSYHELDGGWGALERTQLDWAVGPDGDGVKIDRRRMPDMVMLRCSADVTVDGEVVRLERYVTHARVMPDFHHEIQRIGELPEDAKTISPYAYIESGGKQITDLTEIKVTWHDGSGNQLAEGLNPTISISALGSSGILELRVTDRGGTVLLVDNGVLVTDNGVLIATRSRKD